MKETNGIPVRLRQVAVMRDSARRETVVLEADGVYYIKGTTGICNLRKKTNSGG
ncbi:hypothetical protein LR69_01889 [Geobacillus sp. BCO2]|nr:hypothetical protein LR69_01889 [Geobacillus sp. BCO2]